MRCIYENTYPHSMTVTVSSFVSSCLAEYKELLVIGGIATIFKFIANAYNR